jgi:glycosyltransferase involved in cell wall biosynthesis
MSSIQTTPSPAPAGPDAPAAREARRPAGPMVDVVVPVHNEEHVLRESVLALHRFMAERLRITFRITIAENASSDGTPALADALADELAEVRVLHVPEKGRGGALRAAWLSSDADVVAYTDVDLSTDLDALPELLAPLLAGTADLAIGSRLAPGAEVTRSVRREVISRGYNILLRVLLDVGFSDAQCGFKAGRRAVVVPLLERVEDDAWFFDTELLYLAQRSRLSIHEVPVRWVEDPDSRVAILRTALADLEGIRRLRSTGPARVVHPCSRSSPALPLTYGPGGSGRRKRRRTRWLRRRQSSSTANGFVR